MEQPIIYETEVNIDEPTENIEVIMPLEQTIELRHIRSVIGEKEDLPSLSPRVSLSSKIRSLVTKLFGVPQLIHLQGALGLNKTLTFSAGEDNIRASFSDGTYLYAGLLTTPGKIVKVDLSTFFSVSTLTLDLNENDVTSLYSDGTYLYAGLLTTPAKVIRINLNNFTKKDTLTLDAGEDDVSSLFSDGTYLYAGLSTTPGKIVKVDLSTFTKNSTLSLTGNQTYSLWSDGSDLYASVVSTKSVSKIDIRTFTETSSLILSLFPSNPPDSAGTLFSDGLYLYVLSSNIITGYCTKIDLDTFTEIKYIETSFAYALFSDGTYLYVGSLALGGISKININTFKLETIIPISGAQIDTLYIDGTYIYCGIDSQPGQVIRRYIIPSNDVHQRRIDTTKECIQSIVSGTTSNGNVSGTTLIDTARTEGNDYWNNMTLLILGGTYKGQSRRISDFDAATDTITVSPSFDGQILSGVRYAILPNVASGATSTLTQADILSDATPFAGADIATINSNTNNLVATVTNGTYSHANNTNEQDLLIFSNATQDINLYLDMTNITQTSTLREYIEVDGATYRQLSAKIFPTDFDTSTKSISISFKQPNRDYKVTLQSSIAEGSAKDISYSYRTESRS